MTGRHQLHFRIEDAETGEEREVVVETDKHGLTVSIEYCEEEFVLDLSNRLLRVFKTNENGEVASGPSASILLEEAD